MKVEFELFPDLQVGPLSEELELEKRKRVSQRVVLTLNRRCKGGVLHRQ